MDAVDTDTLLRLCSDAEYLKNYRENGTIYREKCAEVLERIRTICEPIKIEELTDHQVSILKSINKIISAEEQFSRSSSEARSPDSWRGFLND